VNGLVAAAGVAIAAALGWVVARTALRPVNALTDGVQRVASTGDFSGVVTVEGSGEIANLAVAFNSMLAALTAARESQRRLIEDASHELRTPVAVVRARAEVLERQASALPMAAREEVWQLRREAQELSVLLDALLDLARLDGQQVEPALEPVALAEVAEEIVSELLPLAESRGVQLEPRVRFVWARANLTHLRQILRALADNALKYTPSGGSVVIAVAREGDWACLTVADTGQGIAPQHLPRVFEPFYHDDSARRRALGGAGLGLTIAAQLVRLMHGRLLLDSTIGSGTTARVLLPLAGSGGTYGQTSRSEATAGSPVRPM
jgi:two-component system sensor histidine kinase MprB